MKAITMNFRICDEHSYGERTVKVYDTEVPTLEARLAINLIERWGAVSATPDGEDSAGRQAARLLTPVEVVTRAFEIASAAMDEIEARGLMLKLPDLNEINAERDAEAAKKRARSSCASPWRPAS